MYVYEELDLNWIKKLFFLLIAFINHIQLFSLDLESLHSFTRKTVQSAGPELTNVTIGPRIAFPKQGRLLLHLVIYSQSAKEMHTAEIEQDCQFIL